MGFAISITYEGVIRFEKNGKFSLRYVDPDKILNIFGNVAYELDFPAKLPAEYMVFYISLLKMWVGDLTSIKPLESVVVKDSLTYEDVPVGILDR